MDYQEPICPFDTSAYTGVPDAEPTGEEIPVRELIAQLDALYNSGREAEGGHPQGHLAAGEPAVDEDDAVGRLDGRGVALGPGAEHVEAQPVPLPSVIARAWRHHAVSLLRLASWVR